jgi:hypothetical protein
MSTNKITKTIVMSLTMTLVLQLTGCGIILHPERKGQIGGKVDPTIAILDGIGLLLFLIPGVVAFAVDFSTGTIYLPHGRHSSLTPAEMDSIKQNGKVDVNKLNALLSRKLGQSIDVQSNNVQVKQFSSEDKLLAYWAATNTAILVDNR